MPSGRSQENWSGYWADDEYRVCPVELVHLCPNMHLMYSNSGMGALLGPPVCGWLIAYNGFKSAQIISGVMLAFGSCLLVCLKTLDCPHVNDAQMVTRAYLAKGTLIV